MRFRSHLSTCRGCQLVAAEIDTVSQRLRSILPAALLGGAAVGLYAADTAPASAAGSWTRVSGTPFAEPAAVGSSHPALTDGVGAAAHASASATIPASGLAALATTAVVLVGAIVVAAGVLSLPTAMTHSDASSIVEASGRIVEVPVGIIDRAPTDEGSEVPQPEESSELELPGPPRLLAITDPEWLGLDDAPAPSATPPSAPAQPTTAPSASAQSTAPKPTSTPSPQTDAIVDPPSGDVAFRITRTIAQGSLVPPRIEGTAAPGSLITAFDESGASLDAASVGDDGTFSLDVSGERVHQNMTVRVRQKDPRTGAAQWTDAIGPLFFAVPTIATADPELCRLPPLIWSDCLHLRAEPGAWIELFDAQGRSLIVRLASGGDEGVLREAGALGSVVAARYIDPTTGRAGVTAVLTEDVE